jgi:translocation and assembly module TamB
MTISRRTRWIAALAVLGILTTATVWLYQYLNSREFSEYVRQRIIAEVERASGGRAEVKAFSFTFPQLTVAVDEFTLHGKEPAGDPPLFHAKRIEAEIRILSFVRQIVDLRALRVVDPHVRIVSDEHGNTNLPEPKIKPQTKRDFIDTLLQLEAKRMQVDHGVFELNDKRVPLELKTAEFALLLKYEALGPRYAGTTRAKDLDINAPGVRHLRLDLEADTALEHGIVRVTRATLKTKESMARVSGFAYELLHPSLEFALNLDAAVGDLAKVVKLPVEPSGKAAFAGRVAITLDKGFQYALDGLVKARGLGYREGRVEIKEASLQSAIHLDNSGVRLKRTTLDALGGQFTGAAQLREFRDYEIEGEIAGIASNRIQLFDKPLPFAAIVAGPVRLNGSLGASLKKAAATLALSPAPEGRPLQGALNIRYENGVLEASNSYLSTPDTEVVFDGALNSRVHVGARTSNLAADVQPFLEEPLPIGLRNGSISFDGFLTGPTISDPRITGKVTAHSVVYDNQLVDRVSAEIEVDRSRLRARSAVVDQAGLHLTGDGSLALADWKATATSAFDASADLRGARIERLLRDAGQSDIPITGLVNLSAHLKGSFDKPEGEAAVTADQVVAFDEPVEKMRGKIRLLAGAIEITDGQATVGRTQVPFTIRYTKGGASDWKSGSLRWRVQGAGVDLAAIRNLKNRVPDIAGAATLNTDGELRIAAGKDVELRYLQGDFSVPALRYKQATISNVQLRAATKGLLMGVTGRAAYQGARLKLAGEWKLDGKAPGEGTIGVTGGSLESLIAIFNKDQRPMPFQSAVEGEARFKAALLDAANFQADLVLRRIQLNPAPTQTLRAGTREQDLVVINNRPVTIHLNANEAVIQSAQFSATNTRFDVSGRAGFGEKAAWDLRLLGAINMAQLQIINKDLLATGIARLDAAIRGPLDDPQVNGSLQLTNSSLYFGDLPTGIDNVNGSVLFDRNRATVQALQGESGGGKFALSGFVGFGGPALVYRLQAIANGVRVRYPEGASTTVNANLSLTGTSEDSLLGGTVTIVRAGFNPRTDFASMLAETAKSNAPVAPAAASNEYLRGMQFDLRVESAPNLEFQTSLTRGLRAEVDLRLRGNLARPSLIGNVSFNEGEIQLFGNRYTLNRGDIRFFNPTRIEPTFDLEAETRARGITVNVSFSGTPRKINAAYRSDPPLQPSEIIALLAIGRDPNVGAGLATSQSNTQSTLQGVGSLVGEAVAQSLNGRLQKFFGVTRIKIDPQLTGVENIPQARLSLEQQVSKDITLTYITNLARTQEQIVRIQWDISRQWSAIAVREENGLFGIDFQFRKRFK